MKLFAYIDPGTGSVIVQAIIGAIVGGGYILRKNFRAMMGFLKRKPKTKKPDKHDD